MPTTRSSTQPTTGAASNVAVPPLPPGDDAVPNEVADAAMLDDDPSDPSDPVPVLEDNGPAVAPSPPVLADPPVNPQTRHARRVQLPSEHDLSMKTQREKQHCVHKKSKSLQPFLDLVPAGIQSSLSRWNLTLPNASSMECLNHLAHKCHFESWVTLRVPVSKSTPIITPPLLLMAVWMQMQLTSTKRRILAILGRHLA